MMDRLDEGKELYEFVGEQLAVEIVGISPERDQEGYLLINFDVSRDVYVYRYNVTFFENATDRHRSVSTHCIQNDYRDTGRTLERIKIELVNSFEELPNPNTFLVVSKLR